MSPADAEDPAARRAVAGYFEALGREVERRWAPADRRPGYLVDAARGAFAAVARPPALRAEVLLAAALWDEALPPQTAPSDAFGQPPLILFQGDGFFVQALIWMDGSTDIHQHGFEGAFLVAEGSSLHATHGFDADVDVADGHLVGGTLTADGMEILHPGDVRPIPSGAALIHVLFHLEMPTVTIVVRNATSGLPYPQYSYRWPGVAYDRGWSSARFSRRVDCLRALRRIDAVQARRELVEFSKEAPLWLAYRAVDDWASSSAWSDDVRELHVALEQRHAALDGLLVAAAEEAAQQRQVLARRGMLTTPSHRTLLALVASLRGPDAVLRALRQLAPAGDPVELLLTTITELALPAHRSISGIRLQDGDAAALGAVLAGTDPRALDDDARQRLGRSPILARLLG